MPLTHDARREQPDMALKVRSTRGYEADNVFEAFFRGAAPDGGLYLLEGMPSVGDLLDFSDRAVPPFDEFAGSVLDRLLGEQPPEGGWHELAARAFPFAPALRPVGNHTILELFHGPTCAFKDYGARFLAQVLQSELSRRGGGRLTILTATSGDTGGAVGAAFDGLEDIDVVILYPSGRISKLQEKQLTTLGDNVRAVEVAGSFDDCQRMVKDVFADATFCRDRSITSANSINLGRLVPQSLYYMWAAAQLSTIGEIPLFCVPSGNFGNLTAGVLAFWVGMPARGFIAATNANDIVPKYLYSGTYEPRESIATISNAMDVGRPSNFERLQTMFDGDHRRMAALIHGQSIDETVTRETMRRYFEEYGVQVCPHTAVGLAAADRYGVGSPESGLRSVVLATAHPGKFADIVKDATGRYPLMPERLERALEAPGTSISMPAESAALREWLAR